MSASTKKRARKEQKAAIKNERMQKERADAKKTKILTIVFVCVLVAAIGIFLFSQISGIFDRNGVFEKNSVAVTIGDEEINSVVMNYYFMDAVSTEYNQKNSMYGDYTDSYFKQMGLDLTLPLNEQPYNSETGDTWADYFLDSAYETAKGDYVLYNMAQSEGFQLPEDVQASLDNAMFNIQFSAQLSGASSTDAYLRAVYGNGADEESYREYQTISATASAYYSAHMESLSYTDADYRAHEAEDYNKYSAYTFNSYYINHTSFLEGGQKDEEGKITYTDEQRDAARKAAEVAAIELAKATSVEELNTAIGELSYNKEATTKPTSTANTDVMHSTLHEDYANWLSESGRKANDVKYFPSTSTTTVDGEEKEVVNGYYVLMFVSRNDNLEKLDNVRHLLVNFEGGKTENNQTTYSDEEKAKAKEEAQKLLDEWKAGAADEASFIELVKAHTDDDASKETGGLYEDIHRESNFVENFRNWAISSDRKVGDTGLVESPYGYHVMYYVGEGQLTYRDYLIKNDLITADMEEWFHGALDAVTLVEGDTDYLSLDLIYKAS